MRKKFEWRNFIDARYLESFNRNFAREKEVVIPKPYAELSTSRVLTMDRLDGISLANADELVALGYDLAILAERKANVSGNVIPK